MTEFGHLPIMVTQVIEYLKPHSGGVYLDGTMGGGGHSKAILEASSPDGILIALDRDEDAISAGRENLSAYGGRVNILKAEFSRIEEIAKEAAPQGLDGILLDIGVSSYQLDKAERGFSYMQDAPHDMRMDRNKGNTAYDVVNRYSKEQLTNIIYKYGEENWAKRIAEFIVAERSDRPIETTFDLVRVIKNAIPQKAREKGQHPAKRTFQALRIEINDELGELAKALDGALASLKPGGRLAVITFHSLEDRIVKEKFIYFAKDCICPPKLPICVCDKRAEARIITKKPVIPDQAEVLVNPRARSAKLRVAEKF